MKLINVSEGNKSLNAVSLPDPLSEAFGKGSGCARLGQSEQKREKLELEPGYETRLKCARPISFAVKAKSDDKSPAPDIFSDEYKCACSEPNTLLFTYLYPENLVQSFVVYVKEGLLSIKREYERSYHCKGGRILACQTRYSVWEVL